VCCVRPLQHWAATIHSMEASAGQASEGPELSDKDGRLYGVLRDAEGELRDLGTWQQQVAEFPPANEGVPWHGYPIWAVNDAAPANRSGEKVRPAKTVFARMEQVGLITARQRKRLYKGDHV
jgi:hypothetical protein